MKLKNQRGASAVEFAIVLFPLVLLVFGIIDFGFLLYDKAMLTNASREGARAGIVAPSGTPPTRLSDTGIRTIVRNYLSQGDSLIPPPPTVPIPDDKIGVVYTTQNFGDPLTVGVSYHYNYFFLSIIGISGKDLTAQTTMLYE
jgi:hypothetical protein